MPNQTSNPLNLQTSKSIVIACGGTGGHIHPALAVADTLRADGHTLALILSGTRTAEKPTEASWQGPLLKSGARPIKDPRNLLAILRCLRFLKRQRPDVLFATGGYTSFAPVIAARLLGIPVILHEANSLAGKAVRFLARHCTISAVATSFEDTAAQLPGVHTVFTGLPLRTAVLERLTRAKTNQPVSNHEPSTAISQSANQPKGFTVLVTGGSQGAHGMNLLVTPVLASLAQSDPRVHIIHQCGAADVEAMRELYAATPDQVEVLPFITDMGAAYAQADLVIARAGAATCFELARCTLPTLFIPLPTAADDHQRKNAEALVKSGGALCFDQRTTSHQQLAEALRALYNDPELLASMRERLSQLPAPDAARAVADLILYCATR